MKAVTFLILGTLPLAAQDIAPKDSERDPVLNALLAEPDEEIVEPEESMTDDTDGPVLVTGNPPEHSDLLEPGTADGNSLDEGESTSVDLLDAGLVEAGEPADPGERSGVTIEIEGGTNTGRYDADQVKLLAPFPAKPLIAPPSGWKIVQPEGLPAFSETAELPNGTELNLSIRPHLLVPDADGSRIFALSEPGFDARLGYAQTDTIGSVLADTIHALDENGERLDDAARRLSELLDSLPAAAPEEGEEEPEQEDP
ncbi:hypothetical protein [Haloferula sp. A504]|uniref:hypothetical protein n=1 Tax=Haloferula sp. A504 TaxID=3373601 RepID=UPI0031C74F8A|nr:hypothetical protein [Verrucomicrobiaceae bacterium E54]